MTLTVPCAKMYKDLLLSQSIADSRHTCLAVRCMDCNGAGQASAVIAALEWVAAHLQLPAVVSMSLGATGVDTTMDAAVQSVISLGVTVVAAAGNSNAGMLCPYPCMQSLQPHKEIEETSGIWDLQACQQVYLEYLWTAQSMLLSDERGMPG